MQKNLILLVVLLVFFNTVNSQSPANIKAHYLQQAQRLLSTFNCTAEPDDVRKRDAKMVTDASFDTLFRPILSNVFIGSADLATNTTAGSFTQDAEKGTLSFNYSILGNNTGDVTSLGMFSKSSDGPLGLYFARSWNADIGMNFAYAFALRKSRYFDSDDCDKLSRQRTAYTRELLKKYGSWLDIDSVTLKNQIAANNLLLNGALTGGAGTDYNKLYKDTRDLDSVLEEIRRISPMISQVSSGDFYTDNLEKDIAQFEKTNAAFTGYHLRWAQGHVTLSNNKITANADSLGAVVKSSIKPHNTAKLFIGASYHWISDSKKRFFYASVAGDFGLRNVLDHPRVKDPFLRRDTVTQQINVFNKDGVLLNAYDNVKANVKTFEPFAYASLFFLAGKSVGLDVTWSARMLAGKPAAIKREDYPDIYTLTLGPVIRLKRDEAVNKGTIGVEFGIVDAPFRDNGWDYFGGRLKVGLPFTALIK